MRNRLYPSRPGDAPADLLRLAEEFRTYLGQAALDELIRTSIVDEGWQPGPMHRDLLELPWSDVLTTNWDTLLERGAREVTSRAYETVRSQADLPHARAPRIIKLHGSVGADDSFTVAEEDFRRYPTERAAFVNTARQVFLENELCLVGFSGDDPNYGQWSGWVRDHLAGSARRVYLVGDLHLSAPKRKFLEARNIAPVDLADLPSVRKLDPEDRPAASIRAFLHHLEAARPRAAHDWPCPGAVGGARAFKGPDGRKDPEEVWAVLKCAADGWRLDRENYPGWLICPASVRRNIHYGFGGAFWPTDALLTSLGRAGAPPGAVRVGVAARDLVPTL